MLTERSLITFVMSDFQEVKIKGVDIIKRFVQRAKPVEEDADGYSSSDSELSSEAIDEFTEPQPVSSRTWYFHQSLRSPVITIYIVMTIKVYGLGLITKVQALLSTICLLEVGLSHGISY